MSLRSWTERLLREPASPDVIELHIKDVAAAVLAGLRTNDGHAIARRHREDMGGAELASTVSAIARLSESDDIHLASCVTPGAIVIPVALALSGTCPAETFNRAVSAGYAAAGLGTAIGGARALARGIWPTLLAAPVMAAVTASLLKDSNQERLAHAVALALADANGRLASPGERWASLADAVLRGIRAAERAHRGERGDLDRVPDGIDLDMQASAATIETVGFKPFPIARQGANAVVAFQRLLAKGIDPRSIDAIEVFVPEINVPLLNRAVSDRLSRLCNIGLQLSATALAPDVLYDPERIVHADLTPFARRVSVDAADDLEDAWPHRWAARVVVRVGRERMEETVIQAPFDHDAPGLRQILQEKWRRMLPEHDLTLLDHGQPDSAPYATLWQQIERRVRTATEN